MRQHAPQIAVGLTLLILVALVLGTWQGNAFSPAAQRRWILQTVQELSQVGPPAFAPDQNTNDTRRNSWCGHPGYLVFSNGWAAYRIHTIHDDPHVGDITILRTSDGEFYYSNEHYCGGNGNWMQPNPDGRSPAPSNFKDFIEHYGKYQGWHSFAPSNQVWCLITCGTHGAKPTTNKPFWVWISSGKGTNRTTLLDRRYKVSGSFVSWTTRWPADDCVEVDFYDYGPGKWPGDNPPSSERTNHLMSLSFQRDNRTGKYAQKE